MLFTSPHEENEVALEFWRAYRHLVESRPISELKVTLINRDEFVAFFNAVKSADSDDDVDETKSNDIHNKQDEHEQHDRDGNDRNDEGDGDDDGDFEEE